MKIYQFYIITCNYGNKERGMWKVPQKYYSHISSKFPHTGVTKYGGMGSAWSAKTCNELRTLKPLSLHMHKRHTTTITSNLKQLT